MNPQVIMMLIAQITPLIIKLIDEIKQIQGLSESDKEELSRKINSMKKKVAAITWEKDG